MLIHGAYVSNLQRFKEYYIYDECSWYRFCTNLLSNARTAKPNLIIIPLAYMCTRICQSTRTYTRVPLRNVYCSLFINHSTYSWRIVPDVLPLTKFPGFSFIKSTRYTLLNDPPLLYFRASHSLGYSSLSSRQLSLLHQLPRLNTKRSLLSQHEGEVCVTDFFFFYR